MPKQGQHNNDSHDNDTSRGHNNPDKSMTITAGNVKKQETYEAQAREHEDTQKQAQAMENTWIDNTLDPRREERPARAREGDLTGNRSGSRSNAS
jgi:hypothetical protein